MDNGQVANVFTSFLSRNPQCQSTQGVHHITNFTYTTITTRGSQHSQECKDPHRRCFCLQSKQKQRRRQGLL